MSLACLHSQLWTWLRSEVFNKPNSLLSNNNSKHLPLHHSVCHNNNCNNLAICLQIWIFRNHLHRNKTCLEDSRLLLPLNNLSSSQYRLQQSIFSLQYLHNKTNGNLKIRVHGEKKRNCLTWTIWNLVIRVFLKAQNPRPLMSRIFSWLVMMILISYGLEQLNHQQLLKVQVFKAIKVNKTNSSLISILKPSTRPNSLLNRIKCILTCKLNMEEGLLDFHNSNNSSLTEEWWAVWEM